MVISPSFINIILLSFLMRHDKHPFNPICVTHNQLTVKKKIGKERIAISHNYFLIHIISVFHSFFHIFRSPCLHSAHSFDQIQRQNFNMVLLADILFKFAFYFRNENTNTRSTQFPSGARTKDDQPKRKKNRRRRKKKCL